MGTVCAGLGAYADRAPMNVRFRMKEKVSAVLTILQARNNLVLS